MPTEGLEVTILESQQFYMNYITCSWDRTRNANRDLLVLLVLQLIPSLKAHVGASLKGRPILKTYTHGTGGILYGAAGDLEAFITQEFCIQQFSLKEGNL